MEESQRGLQKSRRADESACVADLIAGFDAGPDPAFARRGSTLSTTSDVSGRATPYFAARRPRLRAVTRNGTGSTRGVASSERKANHVRATRLTRLRYRDPENDDLRRYVVEVDEPAQISAVDADASSGETRTYVPFPRNLSYAPVPATISQAPSS